MKLYIDSREKEKIQSITHYWETNKKRYPHIESFINKTLSTSDICTSDGLVGIERKSSADFIGSICSGKLKQQLFELKENFAYAFLLVEDYEGIMDCIQKNPQIHPNVIIGATASAFAHSRVPICYVGGFYNMVVLSMFEKFYDGREMTSKEYTPIRRAATKNEEKLNIIIGIPNIGFTEGKKLLETFDYSITKIINASIEDIVKIPGFGEKKAKRIKEAFE